MRYAVTTALLAAAAVMVVAGDARTAPVPSEAKVKWQLDLVYDRPRPIRVQLPGQKTKTTFWYMIFSVANRTGKDHAYAPQFDLYTDTGQLLRAGQGTPTFVFREIKALHSMPLLKTLAAVTGKILQGEDNAKHSVATWQDFDPKAGAFDVFVGGLSGETAVIQLPKAIKIVKIDARGNKKEVVTKQLLLTKQLQLSYKIPGEAQARPRTPVRFIRKKWILR